MRVVLALVVACLVAACGLGQSGSLQGLFGSGDAARSARANRDADAIMQGIDQARGTDQRVARDLNHALPDTAPPPVTR